MRTQQSCGFTERCASRRCVAPLRAAIAHLSNAEPFVPPRGDMFGSWACFRGAEASRAGTSAHLLAGPGLSQLGLSLLRAVEGSGMRRGQQTALALCAALAWATLVLAPLASAAMSHIGHASWLADDPTRPTPRRRVARSASRSQRASWRRCARSRSTWRARAAPRGITWRHCGSSRAARTWSRPSHRSSS